MSLPIRAFLMFKNGPEDWTVEVCRDFEAVMAAWQSRPESNQAAILHIGFDRPPSVAFDRIASEFPGRMLFTAAAKFGVPIQFESSAQPVGTVEQLPIHLALHGWGYTEDDPSLQINSYNRPVIDGDWEDWLVSFVKARPEFADELKNAGIFSEPDYLSNEANLSWEVRYRAGLYRFGHLNNGMGDDPCSAVRAAPPWFRSQKLEDIDLTVRLRNVFDRAGFVTMADIGSVTVADLFRMRNFGRKSLADLKYLIEETMAKGPRDGELNEPGKTKNYGLPANAPLLAEVHRTLALLEPRQRDILTRRMGLGCKPETLQSVAEDYNITRERIRQIEAKVTKRIIRKENWDNILTTQIEKLLANRDYPLPVLGLEAVNSWFTGIAEEATAFSYILENFCGGRVSITEIGGIQYVGFLTQEEWQEAIAEGAKILKYASDKNWDETHIQKLLAPALPEKAREFRKLLWEHLLKNCHFSAGEPGHRVLVSFGRGIENAVEAVLSEAETPLHYSEIALLTKQRLDREVDVRRVHSAAANVGILLGRGIYGLEQHLDVNSADLERLCDEASGIILGGPDGRQWHSAELLVGLIERGLTIDCLNKYIVDYALRKNPNLNRLGRMTWSAKDGGSISERIDIRNAVQQLVFDAGRPLTTSEIRQRLLALRGVNDTFQFTFADPIIRLSPGLWGLNDRDLPIPRAEQPALIEHLVTKLHQIDTGIHSSELATKLDHPWNGISPQIILSIGVLDERLKVSLGQFLYLAEWGNPKRETIFQIVQRLVENGPDTFTNADIVKQIEQQSTLPVDTSQVSACLRSVGATFDSELRLWSIDREYEYGEDHKSGDIEPLELA